MSDETKLERLERHCKSQKWEIKRLETEISRLRHFIANEMNPDYCSSSGKKKWQAIHKEVHPENYNNEDTP